MSKGLKQIRNKPWLEHHIDKLVTSGAKSVWIGLGAEVERYYSKLPWLPPVGETTSYGSLEINVVINHNWKRGQFSTIQCLALASNSKEPVWILPVDGQLPNAEVLYHLQTSLGSSLVIIPTYKGKGGHPVLLAHQFWSRFKLLDLDDPSSRLDKLIQGLPPSDYHRIPVTDSRILTNMNEIEDWKI